MKNEMITADELKVGEDFHRVTFAGDRLYLNLDGTPRVYTCTKAVSGYEPLERSCVAETYSEESGRKETTTMDRSVKVIRT